MSRLISFLKGAALGAGVMYFFDPVAGNRRRSLARDRLYHWMNKSSNVADAKYRDLQNRLYGTFAEIRSAIRHDEPTDEVLRDRVRSKIGRYISHPGAIEVAAHDGVVTLKGPILFDEVDDLMAAVRSARGVTAIENYLDVHRSTGNISALQGSGVQVG